MNDKANEWDDLTSATPEEIGRMMDQGSERLKRLGWYHAFTANDIVTKAAAISSMTHAVTVSLKTVRDSSDIHIPLHIVQDRQGEFMVIGSATEVGAKVLSLVMNVMNGVEQEAAQGLLANLEALMAISDDQHGDVMDEMLRDLLDKGDPDKQDGPNASK